MYKLFIDMKKFVGNVNGKTFDNEEDFQKAVSEAVKNMDDNLSISSYYKYSSDEEDEKKELADDPKFVSVHEYFLGDKTPDVKDGTTIEYNVPDELKTRIKEASNRNDIKKSLDYHINKLQDNIKKLQSDLEDTQDRIYQLQETLKEGIDKLNDTKARNEYYSKLMDIIKGCELEEENTKEEVKVEKGNTSDKKTILKDETPFEFLRRIGILR